MSKVRIETSIKTIKQNIQGMDLSPDQSFFVIVSKIQSNITSMYDYYVSIYDVESLQKKKEAYVYSTYKEVKHPCAILSNMKSIIVGTLQHIYFYDENLVLKHKQAHNQESIQDMEGSPDSKLLVVVGGNNVILWDPLTYKRFIFQKLSEYSKICRFSKDSSLLGISTGKNLYIYNIPDLSTALITSPQVISSESAKVLTLPQKKAGSEQGQGQVTDSLGSGQISYFDFSPINSQQIAISFGNLSPKIYNTDTKLFTSLSINQQPHVTGNAKYVRFMPDGKRVFSSDDRGYGLWSGSDKNLTYIQDNRVHELMPYSGGKKVLGYRWFQIVKIEMKFQCNDKTFSNRCPCQSGSFWDMPALKCSPCLQGNKNICECGKNQYFNPDLGRCVYICEAKQNTIKYISTGSLQNPCLCERGYNLKNKQCVFDCNHVFSLGIDTSTSCQCKPTFVWNNTTKKCECEQNTHVYRDNNGEFSCECLFQYVRNDNNKCVPDCKKKRNALELRDESDDCQCQPGFSYRKYQNISTTFQLNKNYTDRMYIQATNGDCIRNCSMVNDTIGNVDTQRCSCRQYMYWAHDTCNLNCQKLPNGGSSVVQDGLDSCPCSPPYTWVAQIKECGRSCSNIKYVNTSKFSNSRSCPCYNKFVWESYNNQGICKVDCKGQVNYSLQNNPTDNHTCICKDAFNWNQTSLACEIDCEKIWDADKRLNDGQCSCKNNKQFNKQKRLCEITNIEGTFTNPWIWVVVGLGSIFVIIVLGIMIKFCWKFSNNKQNKQHNKKLKKRTQPVVKKRKLNPNVKGTTSQRAQIIKQ